MRAAFFDSYANQVNDELRYWHEINLVEIFPAQLSVFLHHNSRTISFELVFITSLNGVVRCEYKIYRNFTQPFSVIIKKSPEEAKEFMVDDIKKCLAELKESGILNRMIYAYKIGAGELDDAQLIQLKMMFG